MGNPYAPPQGQPNRPAPQQPPPVPRPPVQPPRPAPDPQQVRAAARKVGRFALLMLAGLLCLQLPVPWQAAGILFTGAGLVVGALAVRAVVAAGMRGSLVVSLALGLGLGALMLLAQIALVAVWPATLQLQECRADALTVQAEDDCRRDYERWLEERSLLTRPSS